jgi:hypothetical protein
MAGGNLGRREVWALRISLKREITAKPPPTIITKSLQHHHHHQITATPPPPPTTTTTPFSTVIHDGWKRPRKE